MEQEESTMETAITTYEHEQFGNLRGLLIDGEPWFVAKDVAIALGYKDPDDAVRNRCEYAMLYDVPAPGRGVQKTKIINEPDFYRLVFGSKIKKAKAFQRWVYEEVLPAIRKTGGYSITASPLPQPQPPPPPNLLLQGHQNALTLLAHARNLGLVGETFVDRYTAHALAEVAGAPVADGERIIDVGAFLREKGYTAAQIRQMSPTFGKVLKAKYASVYGREPERLFRFVNGSDRQVYCYTEKDRPLFEQVLEEGMVH